MFGGGDQAALLVVAFPIVFAAAVMCGALAAVRFRIPMPLWWLFPWIAALAGAGVSLKGLASGLRDLHYNDPGWRPTTAVQILAQHVQADANGWLVAALAAVLLAAAAAPTAWVDGQEWSVTRALAVAAAAFACAAAAFGLCRAIDAAPLVPVALGLAAPPLGLLSARTPGTELGSENARAAASLVLFAIGAATIGSVSLERANNAQTLAQSTTVRSAILASGIAPSPDPLFIGAAAALAALALVAAALWPDRRRVPSRLLVGSVGLSIGMFAVPATLSALQQPKVHALIEAASDAIGQPASGLLQTPVVDAVLPTDRDDVDLVITSVEVVVFGAFTMDPRSTSEADLARLDELIGRLPLDGPLRVQVDAYRPWSEIEPFLNLVREYSPQLEIVAASQDQGYGVVLLGPTDGPRNTAATVQEFLVQGPDAIPAVIVLPGPVPTDPAAPTGLGSPQEIP